MLFPNCGSRGHGAGGGEGLSSFPDLFKSTAQSGDDIQNATKSQRSAIFPWAGMSDPTDCEPDAYKWKTRRKEVASVAQIPTDGLEIKVKGITFAKSGRA